MDAEEMFHVSPDFLGLIPLIRHQFGSKAATVTPGGVATLFSWLAIVKI